MFPSGELAHDVGQVLVPAFGRCRSSRAGARSRYLRMLTARATTRATVTIETAAWAVMAIFAHRDSGIVSVGLNAEERRRQCALPASLVRSAVYRAVAAQERRAAGTSAAAPTALR